ncbi:MAG: quinolinate synthase [Candidatus Omnitrophica bacterium]|nr:quinolinate synthase [Candidatus Omnitrophota bacterium]
MNAPQVLQNKLEQMEKALRNTPDQHLDFKAKRDLIERILQLIEEKDVFVLGHNYMEPLVYLLSGEQERGDSLGLAQRAAETDKPIILFDGVRFMAETAKILNPEKKVLIADLEAGCSLAEPFSADVVKEYRERYPGAPVVTYVNSYADIKAESDYCCTSANGYKVVLHAAKEYGVDRVIFFPDSLMGANLQYDLKDEGIEVIYPGKEDDRFAACEVHEKFTAQMMRDIREQYDMPKNAEHTAILAHWECPPEVLEEADFHGSTTQMGKYLEDHPKLQRVYLATECEMAANLAMEYPGIEFVRSCSLFCQHMRKITLEKILYSLENEVYEVDVDPTIAKRALVAINRMLEIK